MATKMYNSHIVHIMNKTKQYFILDVYIALVHMSSEIDSLYLIQMFNDAKNALVEAVMKYIDVKKHTVRNCVDKLISLNILGYNQEHKGWFLKDMDYMHKEKVYDEDDANNSKKFSGYTKIRAFFLSKNFNKMKAREKRIVVYLAQLADSKAAKNYKNFSMNLLKPNNNWLKILKTKDKYYAKYTIKNMLEKYKALFIDNSKYEREENPAEEKSKAFKFSFQCEKIKKHPKNKDVINLVKETHPKEYVLIMKKIQAVKITLSSETIMHIIRAIANIKQWFIKEMVVKRIVNKFIAIQIHKSRENISCVYAYTVAIVKAVLNEYEEFTKTKELNSLRKYEVEEYFICQ